MTASTDIQSGLEIQTVADIARVHGRLRPSAPAVTFGEQTVNYRALDGTSNRLANGLLGLGVVAGTRVAYLERNSARFFEVLFGVSKTGAVLVPINWRLSALEIADTLNDSDAMILLVSREYVQTVDSLRDDLMHVKHCIVLDDDGAGYVSYADFLASQNDIDPNAEITRDDMALQIYTSGTTGEPKGVLLTHGNVLSALEISNTGALGRWGPNEVILNPLPLFHVGGIYFSLSGLYHGGHCVLLKEADAGLILSAFRCWPITRAGFVPAVMLTCLQHPDCGRTDFSSLHTINYGTAPIPLELLLRSIDVFGCGFQHMYGLSETVGMGAVLKPVEHDIANHVRLRSVGRAAPSLSIRVVRPDGSDVETGEIGEIFIRGPCVFKGYWKKPLETAQALREGWLHTGDAGCFDDENYLYIQDRIKDMIVSGGENVYPAEVESAMFGHPAIREVAVIGVPDEKWGEAVKAVVVLADGHEAGSNDLIAYARERIAGYKCPKSIDFVEEMPRNPSGKILKKELRRKYWESMDRQVN